MSEELVHHGIKGMRWGVRRFQKKNGELTSAGKKRYSATKQDEITYGKKGAQRIADRRNKGDSRNKAVAKEIGRKAATAAGIGIVGGTVLYSIYTGKAAGAVKAGKNIVDSYNNVSILDVDGSVLSKYHQTIKVGESAVDMVLRR